MGGRGPSPVPAACLFNRCERVCGVRTLRSVTLSSPSWLFPGAWGMEDCAILLSCV